MSFFAKLFGLDRVTPHDETTSAHLTTVYGNAELAAIEALLRSADMPYRTCDRGAGGVVRVFAGDTMYGTDVFVRPEDLEDARALLTPVDADEAEEADRGQGDEADE